jgi:hypothetical protein
MDMTTPPPRAARRRSAPWRWLLPLLALALAGLAWLWRGDAPGDAPDGGDAAGSTAASATRPGESLLDAATPLPPLPPEPRFSGDAALAYARARDGDAEAARVLALALADCNGFEPRSDDAMSEQFAQFIATPGMRVEGVDMADPRQLAVLYELVTLEQARCVDRPAVDLPRRQALALAAALVEHAARGGDGEGMAHYARIALAPFERPRDVIAHADEVARRHALGKALLEEALDRRVPAALVEQGLALGDGRHGTRDPEASAVHTLAYTLLDPDLPQDDEARGVFSAMVLHGAGIPTERQAGVIDRALQLRDAWEAGP